MGQFIEYVSAKTDTEDVLVSVYTFEDIVIKYIKCQLFLGYGKKVLS